MLKLALILELRPNTLRGPYLSFAASLTDCPRLLRASKEFINSRPEVMARLEEGGVRLIVHRPDSLGPDCLASTPGAGEYHLYNSERQMFISLRDGEYFLDDQGHPEMGRSAQGGGRHTARL